MSNFSQLLDKKMDRARALIDRVDDKDALMALSALFDVLDLVFTEVGQPQVIQIDPSQLTKKKPTDEAVVQTPKPASAGEKIAGKGGLYL